MELASYGVLVAAIVLIVLGTLGAAPAFFARNAATRRRATERLYGLDDGVQEEESSDGFPPSPSFGSVRAPTRVPHAAESPPPLMPLVVDDPPENPVAANGAAPSVAPVEELARELGLLRSQVESLRGEVGRLAALHGSRAVGRRGQGRREAMALPREPHVRIRAIRRQRTSSGALTATPGRG